MRRIVANIIDNALRYGVVARVAMDIVDDEIVLTVEDDGPGVPSDKLQAIFNRFQQVEETESRRHGGVGIGLNISQQLVHAMGGRIGVESEEGKGALFWFELPLQRAAALNSA